MRSVNYADYKAIRESILAYHKRPFRVLRNALNDGDEYAAAVLCKGIEGLYVRPLSGAYGNFYFPTLMEALVAFKNQTPVEVRTESGDQRLYAQAGRRWKCPSGELRFIEAWLNNALWR